MSNPQYTRTREQLLKEIDYYTGVIVGLRDDLATIKEQNALLTVQVQGLRDALEDLLEQFDPRNHQSNCECDPSVGYQCAACKFPSIPAVGAAHDALSALPQSEDVRDAARYRHVRSGILNCSFIVRQARYDGKWVEMGCDVLDEAIDAALSAQG